MSNLQCATCQKRLQGRQRRFCSRTCKNADTNNRYQNYRAQVMRGLLRKRVLMRQFGSRCCHCGYSRNSAALTWHHVDPKQKSFDLDMRSLSNRSDIAIATEVAKCILLCANCHAEEHFPQFSIPGKGR